MKKLIIGLFVATQAFGGEPPKYKTWKPSIDYKVVCEKNGKLETITIRKELSESEKKTIDKNKDGALSASEYRRYKNSRRDGNNGVIVIPSGD